MALVSYTLLILLRNIVAGLDGVPPAVREAADGMGYEPWRRVLRVDLPLATPAIVAGLRIATVTTIGLVTVTALVGEGGFGTLINDGLEPRLPHADRRGRSAVGGAGRSPSTCCSCCVERLLTPWARAAARGAATVARGAAMADAGARAPMTRTGPPLGRSTCRRGTP